MSMDLIEKNSSHRPMIRIHDLWKSYHSLKVLQGLTIDIPENKVTIIVGKSGVGKSVLLRLICGLETADKGEIEVAGVTLSHLSETKLRFHTKQIGMLFQSSALFDSMNIEDNVAFALRNMKEHQRNESTITEQVDQALSQVGLSGYQKKNPSQLSGGQKRRVALARLIVYRPKILLFDEPTTGLDPITARHIGTLIKETQQTLGSTAIVVTHDIATAHSIGDYFALHNDGKISVSGDRKSFFENNDIFLQEFTQDFRNF